MATRLTAVNSSYQCHVEALNKPLGNPYIRTMKRKCRRAAYQVTGFHRFKAPGNKDPVPFVVYVKNSLRKSGLWMKDLKTSTTSLSRGRSITLTMFEAPLVVGATNRRVVLIPPMVLPPRGDKLVSGRMQTLRRWYLASLSCVFLRTRSIWRP
jgi:hypothetical protein